MNKESNRIDNIYSFYNDWENLLNHINKLPVNDFIFRGQSNNFQPLGKNYKDSQAWNLISSYNRGKTKNHYEYYDYLWMILEGKVFNSHFSNYRYLNIQDLTNLSRIEKLYFLQHYGVPTCLIDFTRNPLIALYFALSGTSFNNIDTTGHQLETKLYEDDAYISIYAINHVKLKEYGIESLKSYTDNINSGNSSDYKGLYIDINPLDNISNPELHFNLINQKSSFIFYDNHNKEDISLKEILSDYVCQEICKKENVCDVYKEIHPRFSNYFDKLFIEFRLSYNCIIKNHTSIYEHLKRKRISGGELFNDIQGLKYDLNSINLM